MSRAFISEDAAAASAAELPERPISDGPNLVTPRGLALIEAEIARLQETHANTGADEPAHAAAARDLRYWRARRASATVMPPPPAQPQEVAFGCRVTLRRGRGGTVTYRIVGEDEADPAQGLLSWTSPMAQALMGAIEGEEVDMDGGRPSVIVHKIAGA